MATTRIAVLDDYQLVAERFAQWDSIDSAIVTFFSEHLADLDRLAERLAPFEVIVAMRERTAFRRELLDRLPALRLLVTTGMMNAAIDLDAARSRVVVAGTHGSGPPTAELTWALILGLSRHLVEEDTNIRSGGWQRTVGTDLAGRTLGLLGLGRLGRRVARIGQAFEMDVIAWSANLDAADAASLGVRAVEKAELFTQSDVVSIHLVLSDRTRALVTAQELSLMKSSAILVNTSRGPIVDEDALAVALGEGRIAGAGLDVFATEPLPLDHPLRSSSRTLLTPHLGYVTEATYEIFYDEAVEDIRAFLAGAPVRVLT